MIATLSDSLLNERPRLLKSGPPTTMPALAAPFPSEQAA